MALLNRPAGYFDRRTARCRSDDTPVQEDIRPVIHSSLGAYGYREYGAFSGVSIPDLMG